MVCVQYMDGDIPDFEIPLALHLASIQKVAWQDFRITPYIIMHAVLWLTKQYPNQSPFETYPL